MTEGQRRYELGGLLFICLTAFCWGLLAIKLKMALRLTDSATIVWFRFAFSFAALLGAFLVRSPGRLAALKKPPPAMLAAGPT